MGWAGWQLSLRFFILIINMSKYLSMSLIRGCCLHGFKSQCSTDNQASPPACLQQSAILNNAVVNILPLSWTAHCCTTGALESTHFRPLQHVSCLECVCVCVVLGIKPPAFALSCISSSFSFWDSVSLGCTLVVYIPTLSRHKRACLHKPASTLVSSSFFHCC